MQALYCPEQFEIASMAVRFQRQQRRAMPSVEALWVEMTEVPRVQAAKVPRVETLGVLAKVMRAMLALALMLAPAPMALELMQVLTLALALGTLLLALTLVL